LVPRPEYPRPAFRRSEWINLNGEWEFATGHTPHYDRTILVPFCPESKLSGIGGSPVMSSGTAAHSTRRKPSACI